MTGFPPLPPQVMEYVTTVPSVYGPVEGDATAFEYDGGGGQYCGTVIDKTNDRNACNQVMTRFEG